MKRIACILGWASVLCFAGLDDRYEVSAQAPQPHGDIVLTAIATAAGMPSLEGGVFPEGYREIRMRAEQSMTCCEARPMLRLVDGPGETVGSLWLFRTLVLRPGNPMPREDELCAPLGEGHICVRPWKLTPGT